MGLMPPAVAGKGGVDGSQQYSGHLDFPAWFSDGFDPG